MQDIMNRIYRNMNKVLQEGLQEAMSLFAKRLADPSQVLEMLKGFNVDTLRVFMPQAGFDPYKVLGLERSASDDDVKRAYYDIIARLHPDKVGRDTSFLASIVNLAYQQISKERGLT